MKYSTLFLRHLCTKIVHKKHLEDFLLFNNPETFSLKHLIFLIISPLKKTPRSTLTPGCLLLKSTILSYTYNATSTQFIFHPPPCSPPPRSGLHQYCQNQEWIRFLDCSRCRHFRAPELPFDRAQLTLFGRTD